MTLHFDGEPNRFVRTMALFAKTSRLQQKPEYAKPDARKFRWSRLQARAERMLATIRARRVA